MSQDNNSISKEVLRVLEERMTNLVQTTVKQAIQVRPGEEWAYNAKTKVLTYQLRGDNGVLGLSEEQSIAVLLHELAHANFSTEVQVTKMPEKAKEFVQALNIIEDLRVERRMSSRFPGTYDSFRKRMDEYEKHGKLNQSPDQLQPHVNALFNLFRKEWDAETNYANPTVQQFVEQVWPKLMTKLSTIQNSQETIQYLEKEFWPQYLQLIPQQPPQQQQQNKQQQNQQGGQGQQPQNQQPQQGGGQGQGNQSQDQQQQGDGNGDGEGEGENEQQQGQGGSNGQGEGQQGQGQQQPQNGNSGGNPNQPDANEGMEINEILQAMSGTSQGGSNGKGKSWVAKIEKELAGEDEDVEAEAENAKDDLDDDSKRGASTYHAIKYEVLLKEMRPQIRFLTRKLDSIMKDNRQDRFGGSFRSGRLDHGALYKFKCNQTHLFTRKIARLNKDYHVSLLIDQSGSMSGDPIINTAKGAVLLAEVLDKIGVDFEIVGFNERLTVYKPLGEKFTWTHRRNMEYIIPMASGGYSGATCDGAALYRSHQKLRKLPKAQNIVIVLTDGMTSPTGQRLPQKSINEWVPKKDQHRLTRYSDFPLDMVVRQTENDAYVLGVGIQCPEVERCYTNHVVVAQASDIPKTILAPIRRFVRRG